MAKGATKADIGVPRTSTIILRHLPECLDLCYDSKRVPVMIWGPPGIAKSAHAQQFAVKKNLPYFDIRLAHMDPVDFKGIPYVDTVDVPDGIQVPFEFIVEDDGGKVRKMRITRFAPPDLLPMTPAIVCLEEIVKALPSIQTVASRLILDRSFDGGWRAHPDMQFLATGNRRHDNAGDHALLSHLDNRMVHYEIEPDLDYWLEWVLNTYSNNDGEKRAAANIVTFMKYMPAAAYDFDADSCFTDAHGSATYRSWAFGMDMLATCYNRGTDPSTTIPRSTLCGLVGLSGGEQFFKFLEVQKQLPNVDEILSAKKGKFSIPEKLDILYSFIGALAYKTKPENINRVWEIVKMFEDNEKGDWAILLVRLAHKFCPEFGKHEALRGFVLRHRYVMGLSGKS